MKNGMRFLLLILVAVLLVGCTEQAPQASARLAELLQGLPELPAGTLYCGELAPYEEGDRLTEELISSLYSRADGLLEYTGRVEEAAVYLSSGMDGSYLEVAVFVCYGSADTDAIAAMCLRRAHLVASHTDLGPEDATILTTGRTVYFCLGAPPALLARLS